MSLNSNLYKKLYRLWGLLGRLPRTSGRASDRASSASGRASRRASEGFRSFPLDCDVAVNTRRDCRPPV